MVTVVDTTDPDWWQGKCLGQVGYFPSKYVTKLFPGERPLQVIHTVQVNDGEFQATKLIREQVRSINTTKQCVSFSCFQTDCHSGVRRGEWNRHGAHWNQRQNSALSIKISTGCNPLSLTMHNQTYNSGVTLKTHNFFITVLSFILQSIFAISVNKLLYMVYYLLRRYTNSIYNHSLIIWYEDHNEK